MPDYRRFYQDRPVGDYDAAWDEARITSVPRLDPRIAAVATAHDDWLAIEAAQFVLDVDWTISSYISGNCLDQSSFFVDFFEHPAVRARFPELGELRWPPTALEPGGRPLGFTWESSWLTTARLAQRLSGGPTHAARKLGDPEIIGLVAGFAEAAFRSTYSETLCHYSFERWADWFEGMFNVSFCWIDKATGMVTLIMITDSP